MVTLDEERESPGTLCERVDEAIRSHKGVLMSWMGPQAAVGELARRDEGIEQALAEIAREVQGLHSTEEGGAAPVADHLEAIRSHKKPLLVTTTARVGVGELARRNDQLEAAVREVAREAQELSASPR